MIISMLPLFESITCSSSVSFEEIKLIAIINLIFYVSIFFILFMMSLMGFYFDHHYFHILYIVAIKTTYPY